MEPRRLLVEAIDSITRVSVKWCLSEDYTNRSIWISVSVFATGGFVVFALIPSSIFMFIEGMVKHSSNLECSIKIGRVGDKNGFEKSGRICDVSNNDVTNID